MKLIKRRHLQPAFPTFFDDLVTNNFPGWDREINVFKSAPPVNIKETDGHWEIEVVAPGLVKEDFKLELEGDLLTVSVEKKSDQKEDDKDGKFTKREFRFSSFKRSFTLPEHSIDSDSIVANYESGVLRLTLPKNEEVKNKAKRTIEIG